MKNIKYSLLACLMLMSCVALNVQGADVMWFQNNHAAWFTPKTINDCTLTYEICVHHGKDDDGWRNKDDGDTNGANIYLYIDAEKIYLGKISHPDDYFTGSMDWEKNTTKIDSLQKEGWTIEFKPTLGEPTLKKYGEMEHDKDPLCTNYHYYYSQFILTMPAKALNKKYHFYVEGKWWRYGIGRKDEKVTSCTEVIEATMPIIPGTLGLSDLSIDQNGILSVRPNLISEQNCQGHVKNYVIVGTDSIQFNTYGSLVSLGTTSYFTKWKKDPTKITASIVSADLGVRSENDPKIDYHGFPYADQLSAMYDVEDKSVTLNWKNNGDIDCSYAKAGVWRIYRQTLDGSDDSPEYLLVQSGVPLSSTTFVDRQIDYNKKYKYRISYHHKDWTFDTFDDLKCTLTDVGTPSTPGLAVTTESEDNLVRIKASFTPTRTDAFYQLMIRRDDKSSYVYNKPVPAGVSEVVWEDVHSSSNILNRNEPHDYYVYMDRLPHGRECVQSTNCHAAVNQYTSVQNLRASQGTYSDQVRLTWNLERTYSNYVADNFILSRREAGDTLSGYQELARLSIRERNASYSDKSAMPGIDYMYKLSLIADNSEVPVTECEAMGFLENTGTISGKITYPNGTAVAGVKVVIQAKSTADATADIELNHGESRWEVETDREGYFIQTGIAYHGEGTTYAVTPMYGTHEFSPAQRLVYVSQKSLSHSDVNSIDKSSFKVSGRVTYQYGDFPVEGAKILVDGQEMMRNGKNLCTDYNGEYLVEVPSGRHYISVEKDKHTFLRDGRFPEGKGTYYDFYQNESGVNFSDNTLITIRGRVAGGVYQAGLPFGDENSRPNIGRATLMLKPVSNMSYVMNLDEEKSVEIDNGEYNEYSHTYLLPYNREGGTNQAQIKILTDSLTGEFCAKLPPLSYMVMTGSTASVPADLLRAFDVPQLNPSLDKEYGNDNKKYHASVIIPYQSEPVLEMIDAWNEDGAFGLDTIVVDNKKFPMYTKDSNGQITYTLGYPVYREGTFLQIHLKGYQRYVNMDYDEPRETLEPLYKTEVDLGTTWGKPILENGHLVTLNEDGQGDYMIMTGSPLNDDDLRERQLQAVLSLGNRTYAYPKDGPIRAIMLGCDLSTAQGYLIKGPDRVDFVLRDPPGSESFAELYEGSTITTTTTTTSSSNYTIIAHADGDVGINIHWDGGDSHVSVHAATEDDFYWDTNRTTSGTSVDSYSIDKTIRTGSDANNVGTRGDVYIGKSTGMAYGTGYQYQLVTQLPAKPIGKYYQVKNEVGDTAYLCAYESYFLATVVDKDQYFAYTHHYVESELLPEVIRLRNSYIQPAGTDSAAYFRTHPDDKAMYISKVSAEDECFGTDGQYTMKLRNSTETVSDVIQSMNQYVASWKKILADNERAKLEAPFGGEGSSTIGFSNGATISNSYTLKTGTVNSTATVSTECRVTTGGASFSFTSEWNDYAIIPPAGGGVGGSGGNKYIDKHGNTVSNDSVTTIKVGYTLKDNDQYDNFLVSVINPTADTLIVKRPDGTEKMMEGVPTPMFKLLGGASTRPWEGPEYTKYYDAGTLLNPGTVPIQKCKFWLDKANITDVPSGSEIPLVFYAKNESAIDVGQDYILKVQEGSNDKGLIMMMDGAPIGAEGRDLWISPGQTIQKTIMLRQTNPDVLDYENIDLFMCGDKTQVFELKNTTLVPRAQFSVHFKPSSSPSTLIARDMLDMKTDYVNIATGDSLKMEVTDFDLNYSGFYKLAIQMKGAADTEWLTIHTWGVNDSIKIADGLDEVIGKQSTLRYTYDMHELADQTYEFRTLTYANYGFEDITRAGNTLTIVKDMVAPRLLGAASPKGGILTCDNEVSLQFNEDIYGTRITNANVRVMGELNRQETSHQTGLKFEGGDPVDTQGQITLTNDGVTAEMWVRNDKPDNHSVLFQHTGEPDAFKAGFTADNKVWISAGGKTFVTPEAMKADGWQYLCVGMKKDTANNVHFFCDNWYNYVNGQNQRLEETNKHFDGNVGALNYNKRGRVILGSDFTGLVGSLMLWNKARGFDNEFEDRIYSPTGREEGLAGYWPMTECHGNVAADKVRQRDLRLDSEERWYTARDNYSATFDGKTELAYMGGGIALTDDEDFCLQMWARFNDDDDDNDNVNENQGVNESEVDTLFATVNENVADGGHLSLLMKKGTPVLRAEGQEYALTTQPLSANQWHNLTLNVLRGSSITFYVDGDAVRTLPVTAVGFVMDDCISVGKGFKGSIDEVRLWKASLSKTALQYNLYNRVDSTNTGLLMYLPMDRQTQYTGTEVWKTDPDFSNQSCEYVPLLSQKSLPTATMKAPSLAPVRNLRQVAHDWVASKDRLVINLTEDLYQIEGTTVQFCVDRIADLHGNEIGAPIYWTAFVDMNRLVWQGDTQLEMEAKLFEPLSFTMTIANNGSTADEWELVGMPSWLHASETHGNISPLSTKKITFTLTEGTPIGTYEAIVGLRGNNRVSEPLSVTVHILGDRPDWTVDVHEYQTSATMIAELDIDGYLDEDVNDLVGAFIGDKCVGVDNLRYYKMMDKYLLMMSIYGSDADTLISNKPIQFRIWDASTGLIYPQVAVMDEQGTVQTPTYRDDAIWGTPILPYKLKANDVVEQQVRLGANWNWVSFFIDPGQRTANDLFKTGRAGSQIKSQDIFYEFSQSDNAWHQQGSTELTDLDLTNMYMVKTTQPVSYYVAGHQLSAMDMPITLHAGWSWIGYTPFESILINSALADAEPNEGDLIKSQTAFAQYTRAGWVGNLTYLTPGQGYIYHNTSAQDKTFRYPQRYTATYNTVPAKPRMLSEQFSKFPATMNMTVRVVNDNPSTGSGQAPTGSLMALTGYDMREEAKAETAGLYWMSIHGSEAETDFCLVYYDEEAELYYVGDERLSYKSNTVIGTYDEPYIFDLSKARVCTSVEDVTTAIRDVKASATDDSEYMYDLSGRRVMRTNRGVFISNGKKIVK